MDSSPDANPPTFAWHPEYTGRTMESVHRELVDDISRDQKAYHAALESAEKEEYGAFNTVRDLEKRWSQYDFAWFEQSPEDLADRIMQFERERESRQELIDWQQWKTGSRPASPVVTTGKKQDWRETISDEQRRKLASGIAVAVMVLGLLICIGLYLLVR
jgi:hypothetical protein